MWTRDWKKKEKLWKELKDEALPRTPPSLSALLYIHSTLFSPLIPYSFPKKGSAYQANRNTHNHITVNLHCPTSQVTSDGS